MKAAHQNLDIFDHHTDASETPMKAIHPENIEAQARILTAFVSRLKPQDLRSLADLVEKADYAGSQLGTSSQIKAHENIELMCNAAVLRINRTDRGSMIAVIQSVLMGGDQ